MEKPFEGTFTVVGNFPYNISTEILFKVLDWREDVERVTGMFQKEVAQRIAAPEGNKVYGVTSVLLQAFFNVEYLFEVSEQAFQSAPQSKKCRDPVNPEKGPARIKNRKNVFFAGKNGI